MKQETEFTLPEYLGDIEFLREYPNIIKKIIELSSSKSIRPFIDNRRSCNNLGGFDWQATGYYQIWEDVLWHKKTARYYEIYPEEITQPLPSPKKEKCKKSNWVIPIEEEQIIKIGSGTTAHCNFPINLKKCTKIEKKHDGHLNIIKFGGVDEAWFFPSKEKRDEQYNLIIEQIR